MLQWKIDQQSIGLRIHQVLVKDRPVIIVGVRGIVTGDGKIFTAGKTLWEHVAQRTGAGSPHLIRQSFKRGRNAPFLMWGLGWGNVSAFAKPEKKR